jgi:predicted GNAT family acetyltransferase
MSHPLDRPVWTALTTRHAALAQGGPLAKRYDPSILPFTAAADNDPENLRALAALVSHGETALFAQAGDVVLPEEFAIVSNVQGVQMIAAARLQQVSDQRIQPLTQKDAPEMLALATLTRPGPFSLRSQKLGSFWGIKIGGRLAAMAGERMKQPGLTELSGVCSHPDFRGQGLARLLSLYVAERIFESGNAPYLHAYATNSAAIRLYESIGFELRCRIGIVVAKRQG